MILTPDSAPLTRDIADYPEGIIIPIDKPYRWTSADVIRKVKYAAIRHFGKKNLKVGHAGTLDPLATGVLLVCIGKATKLAEELQSHDKEYVAGVTFGATTPSYDLEKEIDRFFPHEHISAESVENALPAFLGEQDQVAPLFSAKSVDGVRAYELARKLYKANSGSDSVQSSELDTAAEQLLRVSRINISELELIQFHGGTCGLQNRATPLAAGGGAHEVGGVVWDTAPAFAVFFRDIDVTTDEPVSSKHRDKGASVVIAAKAGNDVIRTYVHARHAADHVCCDIIMRVVWIEIITLCRTYRIHMCAQHNGLAGRICDMLGDDVVAYALMLQTSFVHPSADEVAHSRLAERR